MSKENNSGCGAYIFIAIMFFLVINGFFTCMGNPSAKIISHKIESITPYLAGGFIVFSFIMWLIVKIMGDK